MPELAEAGIGLGRRERDWRRPRLGTGPVLFGGGATKQTGLRLAGVARGGGLLWGAELGAERLGQRDEELEEAGREMSAADGSRERDSAGLAGGGKRGWGFEPGAVAGLALGRAGSAGLSGGRLGRRPRSWPYGGGDIGSEGLWGC